MPRQRTKCLVLASLAGSVLLASCGGDGEDGGPTAHVTVKQVFAVPTPYGEEGTASFVALERSGGSTTERFFALPTTESPQTLFDGELETGSYEVRSYQRTCPASCEPSKAPSEPTDEENLDPPSAECEGDFGLEKGSRIAVLITLDPLDGSCEIDAGPPPSGLTRALIEGGFGATEIPKTDLPTPRALVSPRERQREEIPAKVPTLAGSRIDLGGDATAYVYRFESEVLAQAAAPGFLLDSNYNEVAGCGRHIYYTDARRVRRDQLLRRPRDSWQGEVHESLRKVDPGCRTGSSFAVIS